MYLSLVTRETGRFVDCPLLGDLAQQPAASSPSRRTRGSGAGGARWPGRRRGWSRSAARRAQVPARIVPGDRPFRCCVRCGWRWNKLGIDMVPGAPVARRRVELRHPLAADLLHHHVGYHVGDLRRATSASPAAVEMADAVDHRFHARRCFAELLVPGRGLSRLPASNKHSVMMRWASWRVSRPSILGSCNRGHSARLRAPTPAGSAIARGAADLHLRHASGDARPQ